MEDPARNAYAFLRSTVSECIDKGLFRPDAHRPEPHRPDHLGGAPRRLALQCTAYGPKDAWMAWAPLEERRAFMTGIVMRGLLRNPDAEANLFEEAAMVDLALKTLLHDKIRFLITVAGVAFAVTLVFVQVGLFLGMLDNATVTIEHLDADLWVTRKNTPNLDFVARLPRDAHRPHPRVPVVAKADNLIVAFVDVACRRARRGRGRLRARGFPAVGIAVERRRGNVEDLRRGALHLRRRVGDQAVRPFRVGDYREVLGRRFQIIGRTREAQGFTTTPITFMDYD